ncbi:Pentatricopeptide repeat-containing protein [Apostasia shenzhenica]|uniref:Pentatricopeptide repeat-containing protein n=1 Tax=Apostasia shenzhenica TaxID=1088818 RepID=A0A2I0AUM3_9ASPA|nr:Pentatricopeptide repeat-containing protein [Apostasia shenzhenica]
MAAPGTPTIQINSSHRWNFIKPSSSSDTRLPSSSLSLGVLKLLPASPNSFSYAAAIDTCNCLQLGRQVHAHSLKSGFSGCREFLEARLLSMYARCGSFCDACQLFEKMPQRSIHSWVGIFTTCVDNGFNGKALLLFQELLCIKKVLLEMEFFVFPVVLNACGALGFVGAGRELHGLLLKGAFILNVYVGNALVDMYGKCGVLDEALKVFDGMEERDCVTWNSAITSCASNGMVIESLKILERMQSCGDAKPNLVSWSAAIASFAQNGYGEMAVLLLKRMLESGIKPNAQTLASVLPCCARMETVDVGKEIHGYVVRHELFLNPFVVNGLIDVYSRFSDMGIALELFLNYSERNLVSFNAMIVGYTESGNLIKARELFDEMEHAGVRRDTTSWNAIISGYCDGGTFEEALKMFRVMQMVESIRADSFTLVGALTACAAMAAITQGREIHSFAISSGLISQPLVCNSLIEMYCRCHDFKSAESVFHDMGERDEVSWNVLINGHAHANQLRRSQELLSLMRNDGFEPSIITWNGVLGGSMENGHNEFVLKKLSEFEVTGLKPDIYTMGIIVTVCSRTVYIEQGKQAHAYSIRCGYETDVHIGAALIDMYAKCGIIRSAILAFNCISKHNLVSFNTLLSGYAMHGLRTEGLQLFNEMLQNGIKPDAISFLSVLSLCVHVGSVEEGLHCFNMMGTYGIRPNLKHYTCLVDLFSRAGKLQEALKLIDGMPLEPDAVIWGTLLSGCVVHNDIQLGEIAAKRLTELEGDNADNYVLVANLYGIAGRREDLCRTRKTIWERGMRKSPGWSWIEHNGVVHVFLSNDRSHKQANEIHDIVKNLAAHMTMQQDIVVPE